VGGLQYHCRLGEEHLYTATQNTLSCKLWKSTYPSLPWEWRQHDSPGLTGPIWVGHSLNFLKSQSVRSQLLIVQFGFFQQISPEIRGHFQDIQIHHFSYFMGVSKPTCSCKNNAQTLGDSYFDDRDWLRRFHFSYTMDSVPFWRCEFKFRFWSLCITSLKMT
jgi:hypothetical protein